MIYVDRDRSYECSNFDMKSEYPPDAAITCCFMKILKVEGMKRKEWNLNVIEDK